MKQGPFVALLLFSLAIIAGIWIAGSIRIHDNNSAPAPEGKQTIINEITIGTPGVLNKNKKELNPNLEQKNFYSTADAIAMRIKASAEVKDPFEVSVRLLATNGAIVALDPPTATFGPGTSTYCCWQVAQAGQYTLQIFRPEGIVSTIPLAIQAAPSQTQAVPTIKLY